MVATSSTMVGLGSLMSDFSLKDTRTDEPVSLNSYNDAAGFMVAFICNHCPYVLHIHDTFVELANKFTDLGIACFAINSNDVDSYPDDAPDKMRMKSLEYGYKFPYLFDENQEIARIYQAACTPDFFVFNAKRKLVYRGQFDGSRPNNTTPVTGYDLEHALSCVLSEKDVSAEQLPSLGCNIKWKSKP